MLASLLAAFCTHPVRSKMRPISPPALLFLLTVVIRFRHIIQTVILQNFKKPFPPSPLSNGPVQQLFCGSRIGYCESTDVISRHHPDLNLKYQTCLIWSGWPRFVCEQIGTCKVQSVNASLLPDNPRRTSGPDWGARQDFSLGGNQG